MYNIITIKQQNYSKHTSYCVPMLVEVIAHTIRMKGQGTSMHQPISLKRSNDIHVIIMIAQFNVHGVSPAAAKLPIPACISWQYQKNSSLNQHTVIGSITYIQKLHAHANL